MRSECYRLMHAFLLSALTFAIPTPSLQFISANDGISFGGGFQVSGADCGNSCISGNVASSSACTCPANAPLPSFFEAAVDCHAPFARSQAFLCFPGASPLDGVGLGGVFQVDDISGACRSPNLFTRACTCSATYSSWVARVLVDNDGVLLGTTLTACLGPASPTNSSQSSVTSFGGLYQQDDPTPGGQGCRSPNAATGTCTCPQGSSVLTSWRVLVDTQAGGYIGSHITVCGVAEAPPAPVQICSGQSADPSGSSDASAAIQACVDAAPAGSTLQLPAGVFSISMQVKISKAITLTSSYDNRRRGGRGAGELSAASCYSSASACATLRASPQLYAGGGVLFMHGSNISIQRIIIDGNRYNRLNTPTAHDCANGSNYAGHNAIFSGCDGCSFTSSVTMFAVCGTGLGWTGKGSIVQDSVISHNGDHYTHNMWSDGLTLNQASPAVVTDNLFIDNSDINLIFGSGTDSEVSGNTIFEMQNGAFGGVMFDNFNGNTDGDFIGMQFHNNDIECNGRCDFGLEVGPHPW